MKKLISFAVAGAMLFGALGLASCSGDLHNDEFVAATPLYIEGAVTPGNARVELTVVDDATQKYEFTYVKTMSDAWGSPEDGVCFKVMKSAAGWTDDFGGKNDTTLEVAVDADVALFKRGSADAPTNPGNIQVGPLVEGTKYAITLSLKNWGKADEGISIKVTAEGAGSVAPTPAAPVPFVLSGLAIRGLINEWTYEIGGVLNEFTIDSDGNVYYVKEFAYTEAWAGFKLGSSDWANGYGDATITVDGGYVTPKQQRINGAVFSTADGKAIEGKTDTDNILVEGLVSGKTYRMRIKTTPDKTVSIEIVTLTNVNMVISVTGLPDDIEGRDFYLRCGLNEWSVNDTYKVTVDEGAFDITIPTAYEGNSFSKSFEGKFSIKGGDEGDRASGDGWGLQISSAGGNNLTFNFTESATTINLTYANETGTTDGCTFYAVK